VLINHREYLIILQITHFESLGSRLVFSSLVEPINFFKYFIELATLKVASLVLVIVAEKLHEEVLTCLKALVKSLVSLILIGRIKHSEQQVHEKVKTEHQEGNKEKAVPTALVVRRQHHVWIVGSREEDEHEEERVPHIAEVVDAFDCAREKAVSHPGVVEDEHDDKYGEGSCSLHYQKVAAPVLTEHSDPK
jgi:hypothetical protein